MEEKIKSKWREILDLIKKEYSISDVSFKTWLLPLELYSVNEKDESAVICIKDPELGDIGKSQIQKKYNRFIQICIEEVTGYHLSLTYKNINELESHNFSIDKEKSKPVISFNLNEKYNFSSFIVGSNNKLAYAASLAVADSPSDNEYNPLFIYGGPGLGKTHLMHSIAHHIIENSPELKVLYVTSEQYINEIVDAMRNSKQDRTRLNTIKKKYREVNVLMVDDVQFIIGKDLTQEEFFNTFNELRSEGKQIILTSDKHPNQMEHLDIRYRSRFNWGLPVDIKPPEYETRLAILREKSKNDDFNISDEILQFIAENIKTNIRDLEGAYNKLVFRSKLLHSEITLENAIEDIKDLILTDEKVKITNDYIINIVLEHYNVTLEEICSKNRSKNVAHVRHMCMYLCRKITNTSYEEIGSKLGKRDRTTVMHGFTKIETDMEKDASLQNEIDILMKIINHQ
ncbi:MAG: chromosomal replication initiator protein DnaA [Lachnospiraceae bacterium]|nr:chromosomal replication initiator protein DnaA [Lachnospiraceae bacterium]